MIHFVQWQWSSLLTGLMSTKASVLCMLYCVLGNTGYCIKTGVWALLSLTQCVWWRFRKQRNTAENTPYPVAFSKSYEKWEVNHAHIYVHLHACTHTDLECAHTNTLKHTHTHSLSLSLSQCSTFLQSEFSVIMLLSCHKALDEVMSMCKHTHTKTHSCTHTTVSTIRFIWPQLLFEISLSAALLIPAAFPPHVHLPCGSKFCILCIWNKLPGSYVTGCLYNCISVLIHNTFFPRTKCAGMLK